MIYYLNIIFPYFYVARIIEENIFESFNIIN
jgi:hypothetical protein